MPLRILERDQRLRFLESNLEHLLFATEGRLTNAGALTHLKRGLGARHYVLRHCREYLEKTCFSSRERVLSPDVTTEAALHLNGYYLNMRGALDNLAWILQFELNLFPGVTETSASRMKIHLFGDKFLDALHANSPNLEPHLLSLEKWGLDLATFRDPAAHRIPLYVPPGVITSREQYDEFKRLDSLSGAPQEELGGKARLEVMHEARSVAKFEPVFCITSTDGIQVLSISKQVLSDHRRYLHLVRKVLEFFR